VDTRLRLPQRRRAHLVAAFVLLAGLAAPLGGAARAGTASNGGVPSYQHIFVLMMENHNYDQIIGNTYAPHINQLAQTYGLATSYYGVTHPSEPNYVATIGGDYFGIQDDAPYTTTTPVSHTIDGTNLADQLDTAGLGWKAYMGGLPSPGFTGFYAPSQSNQLYASKHNPFMNFADIQTNPARLQHIVPDTQLTTDLQSGDAPAFSFIAPDQCHDMHGGPSACPYSNTPGDANDNYLVGQGDAYVNSTVNAITNSSVWTRGNNAIVVLWDENDFDSTGVTGCCDANPGGGRVATIVITNNGPRGVTDPTPYNHYSLLRTIEDAFGMGCIRHACDTANVTPMTTLFATSTSTGTSTPTTTSTEMASPTGTSTSSASPTATPTGTPTGIASSTATVVATPAPTGTSTTVPPPATATPTPVCELYVLPAFTRVPRGSGQAILFTAAPGSPIMATVMTRSTYPTKAILYTTDTDNGIGLTGHLTANGTGYRYTFTADSRGFALLTFTVPRKAPGGTVTVRVTAQEPCGTFRTAASFQVVRYGHGNATSAPISGARHSQVVALRIVLPQGYRVPTARGMRRGLTRSTIKTTKDKRSVTRTMIFTYRNLSENPRL